MREARTRHSGAASDAISAFKDGQLKEAKEADVPPRW